MKPSEYCTGGEAALLEVPLVRQAVLNLIARGFKAISEAGAELSLVDTGVGQDDARCNDVGDLLSDLAEALLVTEYPSLD